MAENSAKGNRDEKRPTREEQAGRKARIPLGTPRFKLGADKFIPHGKVGRWVNDDPGRLHAATEAGYEFVADSTAHIGQGAGNEKDRMSTKIRRRVGTREGGDSKMAYLMIIDKELYDQDQADKQTNINRTEESLRRGDVEGGLQASEGRYEPKDGIDIHHEKITRQRSG